MEEPVNTISGRPSLSISVIETAPGLLPVARSVFAANVIEPGTLVFLNMEIVMSTRLADTISGLPSPFRSPVAIELVKTPVERSCFKANAIFPPVLVFAIQKQKQVVLLCCNYWKLQGQACHLHRNPLQLHYLDDNPLMNLFSVQMYFEFDRGIV